MQDQLRIQSPQVSAHSQMSQQKYSPTVQMTQLQAEKEKLRKRQEEIDRQVRLFYILSYGLKKSKGPSWP
jgi:hypothetical protein